VRLILRFRVAICLSLLVAAVARADERASLFSAAAYERVVRYLADDDRSGRGVGTPGIDAAAQFLADQFEQAGAEPGGDNGGWFQSFKVSVSSRIGDNTRLLVRGDERIPLALNRDFVPMPFSKRGGFDGPVVFVGYGIDESDAHKYNDYDGVDVKGKVLLMFRYEPGWWSDQPVDEQENQPRAPRHTRHAFFMTKAEHAAKRGAKAILIVNPVGKDAAPDRLYDFASGRGMTLGIPMMNITRAAANEMLAAADAPSIRKLQKRIEQTKQPCSLELRGVSVNGYVDIEKEQTPVKNVVAVVRGDGPLADEYVVVGAHYDHLGVTTNWRKPNDPNRYIHNGADDNASGAAALVLIAEALKHGQPLKRSIVLIAFTAEESGLLGSKHWVAHPTVPIENVVAMLNMDMIGRLKDNTLQIGGMGTGKGFKDLVERLANSHDLKLRDGGGGRGPSDHSSFYGANIPVLFFFTGMHRQYHSPDDDADLVNFDGGTRVARFVMDCLTEIADEPDRPEFQKDTSRFRPNRQGETADADRPGRRDGPAHPPGGGDDAPAMPRVRLGVAPSYGEAEGRGMAIEFVVEGGPAAQAGIRDGDRIVKINGAEVTDVYSYMAALSKCKPGDEVTVVVLRDDKEQTFKVKTDAAPRNRSE
jgi:hypothetical protein